MPSLLSEMLIEFYKNRESKLSSNLNNIYNNVLLKSSTEDLLSYQVRIKRFLISILLGMFTNKNGMEKT